MMRMKPLPLSLACGAALSMALIPAARAAESAATPASHNIVVTATRLATPIDQVGSVVSVITSDEIDQQSDRSVQDVLRRIPGLQFTQAGGPGTQSSVYIRGAKTSHTLVLINGVRANANTDGGFNLSEIPAESIERIEVLRGPQSALYGSDAIGGVINIITTPDIEPGIGGSVSAEYGTKGHHRETVSVHGANDVVQARAGVSYYEFEDFTIAPKEDGNSEEDDFRRFTAFADIGLKVLEDGRIDFSILYTENDTELDFFAGAMVDDPDASQDSTTLSTSLTLAKPITDWYDQRVILSHSEQEYKGRDNGILWYLYETDQDAVTLQSDFFLGESDTLTLGYTYEHQAAANSGNYDDRTRQVHSLFIQNQWNCQDRLFLTLGARWDKYDEFDAETTYRATLAYQFPTGTRLHASAGTGFKAPTMNDLYWPATPWASGNPDLVPETSTSFDLGIEQTLFDGRLVADITVFKSKIENMIDWAETAPNSFFWTTSNVDAADIDGLEASLTVKPVDSLAVRAYYTFTDAEDAATGLELPHRSRHTAGISADWSPIERVSLYGEANYVGPRFDDKFGAREMGGHTLVNVSMAIDLTERIQLYGKVHNLLDKRYQEVDGYATVGRYGFAGLKATF